jgi:hypothetical protein
LAAEKVNKFASLETIKKSFLEKVLISQSNSKYAFKLSLLRKKKESEWSDYLTNL